MTVHKLEPAFDREGTIAQARLSRDGARLAFSVTGKHAGIYVGEVGSTRWRKVVGYADWTTDEHAWSADGRFIAYRIASDQPGMDRLAWVTTEERGKVNALAGQAFAWSHKGAVLYTLDAATLSLLRHDVDRGKSRPVAEFHHHPSNLHAPAIVPSPDGIKIAFSSRNMLEDANHVFVVQRRGGDVVSERLTWIPGANVRVLPFWSPKGVSLGLLMVHYGLDTTGLVLIDKLEGDGDIYYQREGLDPSVRPAWSPDGKSVWLMVEDGLGRLDLESRQIQEVVDAWGAPRFLPDGRLVVEGTEAVYVVE